MARLARIIAPGFPHHVTQRGNRSPQTFFEEADYAAYVALLRKHCERHGVRIRGGCLMPNQVHLIAVPASEAGLAGAPEKWPWSSARPRILGGPDPLVALDCPLLLAREVRSGRTFLAAGLAEAGREEFQRQERTCRPLGPEAFVAAVSQAVGRDLRPGKPGPQPKGS